MLLAAVVVTALAVVGGGLLVGVRGEDGATAPRRSEVTAVDLLRGWDQRRAEAWASGDVAALRSLYTARSDAGRVDRRMLRAWVGRGLRVVGMRMQLLTVRVRESSPERAVLVVTDRLVGGVAVGRGVRVALPRDRASRRTVSLRRVAGEWLVDSVVGQASPARTTSWTVRSRNR
jgi:hypothetical protein